MLKKSGKMAVTAMLALALCACGSGQAAQPAQEAQPAEEAQEQAEPLADVSTEEVAEPVEEQEPELAYNVDQSIDFTLDNSNVRFNHIEKADKDLVDADNALIFVYDFTNGNDDPGQFQSVLRIKYFQNGVELQNNLPYSSAAKEQYELVGAFFSEVMKGGTLTFGQIVVPKDDSPITVIVEPNGFNSSDESQTMEVTFGAADETAAAAPAEEEPAQAAYTAEDVDAALQGTWQMGDQGMWTFDQGSMEFNSPAGIMSGTYEVDMDASAVACYLEASDGTVKATIPFEYDGSTLRVFKNNDKVEELVKL